jgi:hypothetical protein
LINEVNELRQRVLGLTKLEPKATPQRQVILNGFSQRIHCAHPGQCVANERSESKSTLA